MLSGPASSLPLELARRLEQENKNLEDGIVHHRSRGFLFALLIASFAFVGCSGLVAGNNGNPPPPSTLVITNIQAGPITTSSSQVAWTTNVPANSSVFNTAGFSLSGTINPATGGSGTTLALSGAANATTTADNVGNYTFAGLPNGTYKIAPNHAGFVFTPSSQSMTVNGGNVIGVNFTANATPVAPTITTQPTGQTASFSVAASGTAPLGYQWQKNSVAISGATLSSYTTPATTSSDNGAQFTVMVSNTAGSVTSSAAILTVNAAPVAPSITTQPAGQTVTAGQTASFSVAAMGTAPLSYQWQKNSVAIGGATSSTYTTPLTTSSDNGALFTVLVSNTAGSVTSSAATLTVNAAPVAPSITAQPANQTVTAGQTASFTVAATGTAPLSYQWKKNGAVISGATLSSYTTPATSGSDNGAQFTAVVSNTAGSVASAAATLTVNAAPVAPSITTQPSSQSVTAGQTASFSVAATGTAPLSYQWQKNGANIAGATAASYTTPATTSSDNGAQFTVVVSNTAGGATSSAATLTVNAASVAPTITTQPASQTVTAGQTASFSVAATGTAPLSYQWNKNATVISGATSSSYATPATTSSDNGALFTVLISNAAGSVTSSAATLTVTAAPVPGIQVSPPAPINFGNAVIGDTLSQVLIVKNIGTATLSITQVTASGSAFNVNGFLLPMNVSAGQQTTITVAFLPTSVGTASGNISIVSNAPTSPTSVGLSGMGLAATFTLGISPTSLGFGNVNVGNTGSLSTTLTNTGNSNVTISSVTATGTGFNTSGVTPGTILNPNQSATMNVAFAPLAAGNVIGSVSVASNATNSPTMIALSGTGVSITGTIYLNRDLSTGDLYQYTHRDWGLGTDVGANSSGAGLLYHHADVNGRRAAGLTVTPTAQASPAAGSDSVYLWDPVQPWGVSGQEWWLRTSFFFPSSASAALFQPGEAPFQATTGEWNWILELHKDLTSGANTIQFGVMTDYPAVSGQVGTNPRLFLRLAYGNESSPTMIYKEAPALMFDHWYEFLIHVKLDASAGIAEWFLDGQQLYSNLNVPTLFQRSTGPSSVSLTVPNYRWHAPWSATVYVGPLAIGSTQSIVLNAF